MSERMGRIMKAQTIARNTDQKGMALVMVLLVLMVFAILGSVFISRTIGERLTSEKEKYLNQAFYVAEAGGDSGLSKLDVLINTDLFTTVNNTNANVFGNKAGQYANTNDGIGFLLNYVKNGGTTELVQNGSQLTYASGNINLGAGQYQYNIIISQKGSPSVVTTDMWDFSYNYHIDSTGTVQSSIRKVRLDGDFTVRVQRDNFAKYALFTDHQTLPSTTTVWFTNKTNFAGPLHTNDQYNFAFNPSGIFDGAVTQHLNKAKFYNNGFPVQIDAANNGVLDVPIFHSTYNRGVAEIVLSSSVQQQDLYDQAKGTLNGNSSGIFVPNSGGNTTGGIYVKGDANVVLSVNGGGNAVYTITSGGTTKTITVNRSANTTNVHWGAFNFTYNGLPDGVDNLGTILYVDGYVNKLEGTVQKDTQLTVSAQYDVNITNNLKYQDYNPAVGNPGDAGYQPLNATGKTNLLGILSWGGNVNVATTAPNNIEIHGIVMARNGIFQTTNYDDTIKGNRGTATLLGGVITQFYGAFGLFDGTTGAPISGYTRNFVYDTRTQGGLSPPYFPTMNTFIAFTNDLTDKVAYQEGGF